MPPVSADTANTRNPEHRTVSRVMKILEAVIAREPMGLRLADLPEILGAPKSSIHGLARGLVATGYLREQQGRYFTGSAVAMLALAGQQNLAAYHHTLERLSERTGETAVLATLAGESVINLDSVESAQLVRASPPLQVRRPLYPGSYGKVFLAFMDARRRENYLRRKHPDAGERAGIEKELETVRTSGVAFNRGESNPELYGIACPVRTLGDQVTFAIGIAGPAARLADNLDEVAAILMETAASLAKDDYTN